MDSSNPPDTRAVEAAMGAFGLVGGLVFLVIFAFVIFIYWKIAAKAGYPGVASLLMLIPLVNFVIIILFAFTEWPVEKLAKANSGGGYGGPPPGTPWQPGTMNPPAV